MKNLFLYILIIKIFIQNCSENCLLCNKNNKCEICNGYKQFNLKIINNKLECIKSKEIENCVFYDFYNNCIRCKEKFVLNNGKCLEYPNEESNLYNKNCEYYNNEFKCLFCNSQKYPQNYNFTDNNINNRKNECINVTNEIKNCTIYDGNSDCYRCIEKYKAFKNNCIKRDLIPKLNENIFENCIKFTNDISCDECDSFYYDDNNDYIDFKLNYNFGYYNKNLGYLKNIYLNILDYDNFNNAYKYFNNFKWNEICIINNIKNCILYSKNHPNICEKCWYGYFLDEKINLCYKWYELEIEGCIHYKKIDNCYICENQKYYKVKGNKCKLRNNILNCNEFDELNDYCLNCYNGFILENNNCIKRNYNNKSIDYCEIINSETFNCKRCIVNYILNNNNCIPKITGCLKYSNNNVCEICDFKKLFYKNDANRCLESSISNCNELQSNKNICIVCKNKKKVDTGLNQCIEGFKNCEKADSTKCLECVTNYDYIDLTDCKEIDNDCNYYFEKNCTRCKNNKYPSNNNCITLNANKIENNCNSYDSGQNCVECKKDYGKVIQGKCVIAKEGCKTYILEGKNDNLKCMECFKKDDIIEQINFNDKIKFSFCRDPSLNDNNDNNNNDGDDANDICDFDIKKENCNKCDENKLLGVVYNSRYCFKKKNIENNCLRFNENGTCNKCIHGFKPDDSQICSQIVNCKTLIDENNNLELCKECTDNYIISNDKSQCLLKSSINNEFFNNCKIIFFDMNNLTTGNHLCSECKNDDLILLIDKTVNYSKSVYLPYKFHNESGEVEIKYEKEKLIVGLCKNIDSLVIKDKFDTTKTLQNKNFINSIVKEEGNLYIIDSCLPGYFYNVDKCERLAESIFYKDEIVISPSPTYEISYDLKKYISIERIRCIKQNSKLIIYEKLQLCENSSNWNFINSKKCLVFQNKKSKIGCLICEVGYTVNLNDNSCMELNKIEYCLKNKNPNTCEECNPGFILSYDKKQCLTILRNGEILNCKIAGLNNLNCKECEKDYYKKIKIIEENNIKIEVFTCIKEKVKNCLYLKDSYNCAVCEDNYFLTGKKKFSKCFSECDTKSSPECFPNIKLINWCKKFNLNKNICEECLEENKTLSYDNSNCDNYLKGCYKFDITNVKCEICLNKLYYLTSEGYCKLGNKLNCLEYENNKENENSCSKCKDGYFLFFNNNTKNKSCYSLPDNKNKNCSKINSNFISTSSYNCECQNNLSNDHKVRYCSLIDLVNCKNKNKIGECMECIKGFYLKNNKCYNNSIIDNCYEYEKFSDNCFLCKKEFYYNSKIKKCIKLNFGIKFCKGYIDYNTCKFCLSKYYLKNNKCLKLPKLKRIKNCLKYDENIDCYECKKKFFLNEFKICKQLYFDDTNCIKIKSAYECSICNKNSYLNRYEGNCIQIKNCLKYDKNTITPTCLICKDEFYFHEVLNECLKGDIENCLRYEGSKHCIYCKKGYLPEKNENGYFCKFYGNDKKIKNCKYHKKESKCLVCKKGFFLNSENKCENCEKDCMVCDSYNKNICYICNEQYYQNKNSTCILKSKN